MSKPIGLIFKGILSATVKAVTSMLIPFLSFNYVKEMVILGTPIGLTNEQFSTIMFWIVSLGIIQVAVAFGKGASPKRSPRKAIFFFAQIIVYAFYLWCYKFSGAASLTLNLEFGSVTYDLAIMLKLWMGVVVLKMLIALYDLIDGFIFTKKAKEAHLAEQAIVSSNQSTSDFETYGGSN